MKVRKTEREKNRERERDWVRVRVGTREEGTLCAMGQEKYFVWWCRLANDKDYTLTVWDSSTVCN